MYEAIVKGENVLEPGLPESFNVMTKELMSLGLDVQLEEREQESIEALVVETGPQSIPLPTLPAAEAEAGPTQL